MRKEDEGKSQRQLEREAGEREAAGGRDAHKNTRPFAPKTKRSSRKTYR